MIIQLVKFFATVMCGYKIHSHWCGKWGVTHHFLCEMSVKNWNILFDQNLHTNRTESEGIETLCRSGQFFDLSKKGDLSISITMPTIIIIMIFSGCFLADRNGDEGRGDRGGGGYMAMAKPEQQTLCYSSKSFHSKVVDRACESNRSS